MEVIETALGDVKLIQPKVFGDERGFFMETFRTEWFRAHCADVDLVQDNHSLSQRGTLRGLHYQTKQTQGKLVRVVAGEVFDVVVDMRESSPTFGQWYGVLLSAQNKLQLWVPAGFAHGFYVTSEQAEFTYKCSDYYHPESEVSIRFDDPTIGVQWPFDSALKPSLSAKDAAGISFAQAPKFTSL
ncbi:dTDP-4-dehydrorhamnose 3,5-epimerase [Alteromonas flava]|uniref:dTDP-4-dehydrorhamnose 3,5-epimerase n=1 Tax=Alteromonas flava TaxID=2048003 RepID=UPI000C28CA8E|nr:dTDP-4-dehydrorhamnose 3,5-epimerase [Alteromonas flava]